MIKHRVQGVPFLDIIALFESIKEVEPAAKLAHLLQNSGVEFHDPETLSFIKTPSVALTGIGGVGFDLTKAKPSDKTITLRNTQAKLSLDEIKDIFTPLQAAGGFMSYLNSGNLSEEVMVSKMVEYKHFSTLHLSYINIAIFGISSLVENEINCQRDSMHIARITEARTNVQVNPPLVVRYPEHLEQFKAIQQAVNEQKKSLQKPENMSQRDFYEATNMLSPASKGTGVIISVTLKNLRKFVDLLNDSGKEEELKRVLASINDFCHLLWPQFFQATEDYDYKRS